MADVSNFDSDFLIEKLHGLRKALEPHFSSETALPGTNYKMPSSGHCAVVSTIVHDLYGGDLVSTILDNQSHWFNRFVLTDGVFDIDITGDQFGYPIIQKSKEGTLYPNARIRSVRELNQETKIRAEILANKAGVKKEN